MLKIRNNDISFNRGESVAINIQLFRKDGVPYILPPTDQATKTADRKDYLCLAFTVRTAPYGDIVIQKYYDLEATPTYYDPETHKGKTDYSKGGYAKFTSQELKETDSTSAALVDVGEDIGNGKYYVYHSISNGKDIYQIGIQPNDPAAQIEIVPYKFSLITVIDFSDTESLEAKEYNYDVIIYAGQLKEGEPNYEKNEFPYKEVTWKAEIISPHKFTLEDTNNA